MRNAYGLSRLFSTSSRLLRGYSELRSRLGLYFSAPGPPVLRDFFSTSPQILSSLALVLLDFPSRKLTTSRVFPVKKSRGAVWAHRERRSGPQGPILGVLVEILRFRRLPIESPTSFQDFLSTSQDFIVSRSSTFSLTVHRVSNDFLSSFHDFIVSRNRLSSSFQREKP